MSNLKKLLFFSLLLALGTLAAAIRDPELEQCQHQCGKQRQFSEREIQECQEKCERYYREKHRGERKEEERGGGSNPEDPFKRLRECEGKCVQKQDERERRECHERCHKEFAEREKREGESEKGGRDSNLREGEREEEPERRQEGEPYVFQDQHFSTRFQGDHGRAKILQKFTERSEFLRGIENIRVAIFESNPQTFILPNHWDADSVAFVHQGRGTISLVRQDKRESFNIRRGDVLRVEAGTTVYIVNSDKNEKLVVVKLIQPVSTPGQFEAFFGAGGENPESFFKTFSPELLEAAFNQKRERFERVFQQQKGGVIIKASEEQIKSMSRHEEGGIWPFGSESKGPYNLFKQRPTHSNQFGQFYEVDPSECKDLRELDLGVAFANLSRGAMTAPMYNSRATKIGIVVEGEGYLEISCPHLSTQEGQRGSCGSSQRRGGSSRQQREFAPSYQRVSSKLRRGTVFVVPAGLPFITVASQNENLQVVCFDVKGFNNEKVQLAGKKNIFNHFEREAKELAFGVSEKEVDEVFKSQEEEFFVRGPRQQGRAYA